MAQGVDSVSPREAALREQFTVVPWSLVDLFGDARPCFAVLRNGIVFHTALTEEQCHAWRWRAIARYARRGVAR